MQICKTEISALITAANRRRTKWDSQSINISSWFIQTSRCFQTLWSGTLPALIMSRRRQHNVFGCVWTKNKVMFFYALMNKRTSWEAPVWCSGSKDFTDSIDRFKFILLLKSSHRSAVCLPRLKMKERVELHNSIKFLTFPVSMTEHPERLSILCLLII